MERKEFTVGEADQLDYAYRMPLYSTMELFIETLTGTCFELRVSPYETVISVKAKIQRLEGIPIGQQYLIWHDMELEDDYCLHDYNITDGCTLKLVLAMRGGPINTRRIAMEDPSIREMTDYVESNHEEIFDKISPPPSGGNSSKPVTLLVYRDGDQLNFFRVVDRGDGTLTPFTDSLSDSACNLREDEDDTEEETSVAMHSQSPGQQPLSVTQMVENNITASKMKQLQTHLQNLNVSSPSNRKQMSTKAGTKHNVPRPPLIPKSENAKSARIKSTANRKELIEKMRATISEKSKLHPAPSKESQVSDVKATPAVVKPDPEECAGNLRLTPVSRSALLRSRLKRSKNVTESQDGEKSATDPICEQQNVVTVSNSKLQSPSLGKSAATTEVIRHPEIQTAQEETVQAAETTAGRFSPRTRRLLTALENNSAQKKGNKPPASVKTSPRSSLLQGLTYNRHDLYLRSYGLIASPDEDTEEQILSPSPPAATPPKEKPAALAPQVLETSHGVKYSSVGSSVAPYYWGSRFLKSPTAMAGEPFDAATTSSTVWPPAHTPHPHKRAPIATDSKARPPASFAVPATSLKNPKESIYNPQMSSLLPKRMDSSLSPQPPSQSIRSSAASATWQKQRLKRMNSKPSDPVIPPLDKVGKTAESRPNLVDNDPPSAVTSPRRPLREVSSKSGLRMKESPHGKVESMSRQEAREVVDLINKAMDASILRTFVRSPVKDGQRGNSGQSSGRHRTSLQHQNLDSSRLNFKSSHGKHGSTSGSLPPPLGVAASRVPPVLPPVKQPSKKKRCFHCAKRTGLASSYMCRCGNNFCATHRYAETHDCTYDYKTAGRKLLQEANPLVSAPKLPKI